MRVALVSDIHSNLVALETVLAEAEEAGTEEVWSMGDQVGYGPKPNEVISRLKEAGALCVKGNHDAAALGEIGVDDFNEWAAAAARWTVDELSEDSLAYLEALPQVQKSGLAWRVHGTLRDPVWEYLMTVESAKAHFSRQEVPLSAVGHTHIPLLLVSEAPGQLEVCSFEFDQPFALIEGHRYCINPGSVGQPRDGDPRAAYAVLDTDEQTVTFRRTAYDIKTTQAQMEAESLPDFLAARLAQGR